MEKGNKTNSGLRIDNERKVYAFLSKTIYDELIEYGVDDEYTFSFLLYLHWVIAKKYCRVSPGFDIDNIEKILRHIENTLQADKKTHNQNLTDFINAFFVDNGEILVSIYKDVYQATAPPAWLKEWQNLCECCYNTNNFKIQTCLTLLRITNECLSMSYNTTDISINILLKIQQQQTTIGQD